MTTDPNYGKWLVLLSSFLKGVLIKDIFSCAIGFIGIYDEVDYKGFVMP